ncbi:hypothetical protein, conserved, partial [Trypanosoma vivax Y486]
GTPQVRPTSSDSVLFTLTCDVRPFRKPAVHATRCLSMPKNSRPLTMQPCTTESKARTQSMNIAALFSPPFLHSTPPITCTSVSSVDRGGLNPFSCGCSLFLMRSLTRRAAMRSISLRTVLVSVAGRKDAMLLSVSFGFSSSAMMPFLRLAGTSPTHKLKLNSRKIHLLDPLPICFNSSHRISSSPGSVPEDSSRSETSISASVMGLNAHRLLLGTFIFGAFGAFVDLAMHMLANASACWRLVSGWPSTTSTGDVSGRGACIDFARFQLTESVAVSFGTFSFHRSSAVSASAFLRQRSGASLFRSFFRSCTISPIFTSSGVQNGVATPLPLGNVLFPAIRMPLVSAALGASATLAGLTIVRNINSSLSFLNSFHLTPFLPYVARARLEEAIASRPPPTNTSNVIQ